MQRRDRNHHRHLRRNRQRLRVYCAGCGAAVASSTVGGDDSFDVFIEARHFNATYCGTWQLTVTGNVTTSTVTCFD